MFNTIKQQIYKYKVYVKYLISGGVAASTDLGLLFIFTHYFKIYYLISAVLAFLLAFFVSFFLQKFWTFRDNRKDVMYSQMGVYLIVAVTNLGINTGLMYVFVEYLNLWYLFAQIAAGALIAVESFLIYRFYIFTHSPNASNITSSDEAG